LGHVGQWRNGIFVNDVWQATRNLTLNLGLRWEMNTPVKTYEGFASMLDTDFETIIPSTFPAQGFEFTKGNYKDMAQRLCVTQRAQDAVELRRGAGALERHRPDPPVPRLGHRPPRPQLLQQHADAGPGRGGPAASQPELPLPPHHHQRPPRGLRRGQPDPAQA